MLGWFGIAENAAAGEADRLLARLAADLSAAGLRVAGAVQRDTERGGNCACDMDLIVLGEEDRPIRISQSLGSGSTGCRLDAGAFEMAVARIDARLAGAELLILPKFGRQEAQGRGYCPLIAQAISIGIPVLLHVSAKRRAAFTAFCGDMGEHLAADRLSEWCLEQTAGAL
ncbi:DUF2478 domain-containing protein [Paracoccus marinaquae]|uniref:DUF2478 domain-containing protein n=1 Tax=Paracoccus marinaquae TaxID=2841926 RepID=A0ABS6AP70_9RHOB|nr:DUF2478 domain-containing protein [Paracoccus marinaquae]MBU3031420.1 DUF2478 domain-containing protein [Paracoccus marinaquae]